MASNKQNPIQSNLQVQSLSPNEAFANQPDLLTSKPEILAGEQKVKFLPDAKVSRTDIAIRRNQNTQSGFPQTEKGLFWKEADPHTVWRKDLLFALDCNNEQQFRLDWVRKLQNILLGKIQSTNGDFDYEMVLALQEFQKRNDLKAHGIVDAPTRARLEKQFPSLLTTILGPHLDKRCLLESDIDQEMRYQHYQGFIEQQKGVFLEGPCEINLLGIRGIEYDAAGAIWQSNSARDYYEARQKNTIDDHLCAHQLDDLIVSVWRDEYGKAHVKEWRASVDPSEPYTSTDRPGTAHLRDGQYLYASGFHTTRGQNHIQAIKQLQCDLDARLFRALSYGDQATQTKIMDLYRLMEIRLEGKEARYMALRPTRKQEVWRNNQVNDLFIDFEEEALSNQRIYLGDPDYFALDFGINIHTSRANQGDSMACQNIPCDQYLDFMSLLLAMRNSDKVPYTLIDASKIEI